MTIINITAENILSFFKTAQHYEYAKIVFGLTKLSRQKRWQLIAEKLILKGKLKRVDNAYVNTESVAPMDMEHSELQVHYSTIEQLLSRYR